MQIYPKKVHNRHHFRKEMKIRSQKIDGTKIHKCLVRFGFLVILDIFKLALIKSLFIDIYTHKYLCEFITQAHTNSKCYFVPKNLF